MVALASHSPSLTMREPGARPWTQWAAVSTTLTDTRLPPQMKPPVSLSEDEMIRVNSAAPAIIRTYRGWRPSRETPRSW